MDNKDHSKEVLHLVGLSLHSQIILMMLQQLDSPAMRYTVYEMMLLMMDW